MPTQQPQAAKTPASQAPAERQFFVPLNRTETVFDWNNHAAFAMQNGRFEQAANILAQVLKRLSEPELELQPEAQIEQDVDMQEPGDQKEEEDEIGEGEDIADDDSFYNVDYDEYHPFDDVPDDPRAELSQSTLLLYTVPVYNPFVTTATFTPALLELPPHISLCHRFCLFGEIICSIRNGEPHGEGNAKRLTTAIMCYNLGLCLHYKVFASPQNPQERARQQQGQPLSNRADHSLLYIAARFYCKVLRTLDAYQREEQATAGQPQEPRLTTEDALLLRLAALNNLGHIYDDWDDLTRAAQCHQSMLWLLQQPRNAQYPMSHQDWNFFVRTVNGMSQIAPYGLSPAA